MIDPPVRKIQLVKAYLKNHPGAISEGDKIIDLGGIREYYDLLGSAFSPGECTILNIDPERARGVASIVATAVQLPFKDESWKAVIAFDILEHLTCPESLLSEAFRILRSDGLFVLSTANLADIYSRLAFLFGYTPFNYDPSICKVASLSRIQTTYRGHKSVFTYKGITQLLDRYGFVIAKSYGYSYVESLYHKSDLIVKEREVGFNNLRRALGSILPCTLSEGILIICKKRLTASL